QSVGGWMLFPLILLSGISFALNASTAGVWRRLPIWLALLAVSLVQARAVAFFGVAGGPVIARNFQQRTLRRGGGLFGNGSLLWVAASGRAMALVAMLALPALAWAGWLQPQPFEPRRWAVEIDPSLQRMAETIVVVAKQTGQSPRAFNVSVDAAHYLA